MPRRRQASIRPEGLAGAAICNVRQTLAIPVEAVMMIFRAVGALALILPSLVATAADYPAPKEGEWIAREFKFHTGEVMPQLKLHYTTIGEPTGMPVAVLHGTGGSARRPATPPLPHPTSSPAR